MVECDRDTQVMVWAVGLLRRGSPETSRGSLTLLLLVLALGWFDVVDGYGGGVGSCDAPSSFFSDRGFGAVVGYALDCELRSPEEE